jgi:hypothetical protein
VSPDRDLIADSLAVRMPDQQLREVRAFRKAVATTMPDTASIRSGEKDWLKGDTIFAFFDSTARRAVKYTPTKAGAAPAPAVTPPKGRGRAKPADSTAAQPVTTRDSVAADTAAFKPQLREMESIGHASSHYQVAAQGGTPQRPAINYSRGDRITVTMDSAGVSHVRIDEHAVGLYLEPTPDSTIVIPTTGNTIPDATRSPVPTGTPVTPAKPTTPAGTTRPVTKPAAVVPRPTPGDR